MPTPHLNHPIPSDLGLQRLRIFVSYPRGDATHTWAEQVHTDLAARGATVWRDEHGIADGDDDGTRASATRWNAPMRWSACSAPTVFRQLMRSSGGQPAAITSPCALAR